MERLCLFIFINFRHTNEQPSLAESKAESKLGHEFLYNKVRTLPMTQRIDYNEVSPDGAKALGAVYSYVLQCGLPSEFIELVFLRVSQINNCAFCLDMHTRDLIKKNVPIEKLALVQAWREAGELFDDREQAALAWAESVTKVADTGVPDDDFHLAKEIFSEKELVDLTLAISLMNAYNRLAISFRSTPQAAIEQ